MVKIYQSWSHFLSDKCHSLSQLLVGELYISNETDKLLGLKNDDKTSATVLTTYSPIVKLISFSDSISLENGFTTYPSVFGELSMLAKDSVLSLSPTEALVINVSDADPDLLPGFFNANEFYNNANQR